MTAPVTTYTDSLNYINALCDSYVGENVAAVARVVGPFAFTMIGLYVALWGIASLRGVIREPFDEFIKRILTITAVLAIGFSLANYNTLITNTFLRGPDELVAGLARSSGPSGVITGLDAMFAQGVDLTGRFWSKAGVLDGDFGMYLVASAVITMTVIVTAYGFFLMALSKVMLTCLVGLGPLFFIALLFQPTAGYFTSWLRQMSNYFLVPVLVVMINLLVMKLFSRAADSADAAALTSTVEVAQIFPFMAMGLISLLALASVLSVAAGLAGGVSLSSFGMGRFGAGLLKQIGIKGAKGARATAGLGVAGTKKVARAGWSTYQSRKRNTVTQTKP